MNADFLLTQFKTEAQTKYAIDETWAVEFHDKGLIHRRYHLLGNKYFTNTVHKVMAGREQNSDNHEICFTPSHEERPDNMISRVHFMLKWLPVDDAIAIEDLNSTNGTFINDWMLKPNLARILKDGDIIKVGETEILFEREII